MPRILRNILAAVVVIVLTLALFAHKQEDIQEYRKSKWAYGTLVDVGGSVTPQTQNTEYSARPGDNVVLKEPPPPPLIPPPGLEQSVDSKIPLAVDIRPKPNPWKSVPMSPPAGRPKPIPSPPKQEIPLPNTPPEPFVPDVKVPPPPSDHAAFGDDDSPQILPPDQPSGLDKTPVVPATSSALPNSSADQLSGLDKAPVATSTLPNSPTESEDKFPFQKDLDLELPVSIFKELSSNKPHNYHPNSATHKKYAYATFMSTHNPSIKDPYYLAIHSLIYRVLWGPRTRTDKYPFIVFVASYTTKEQRELLHGAGAIVRELLPLEWNPNVPGVQPRWKDLFAKLNMWSQTDFERLVFLDADAFPLKNIDAMFDVAPMQQCNPAKLTLDDHLAGDGTRVCEPYIFAGVPQQPFNATDPNVNVGSMVISPSLTMHKRLVQNYVKTDKYDCLMAEQAFLNWQFSPEGAFPPTLLQREWGGFFPGEDEGEGRLSVVHEKLWSYGAESWMGREWAERWAEMMFFYQGDGFGRLREMDGV